MAQCAGSVVATPASFGGRRVAECPLSWTRVKELVVSRTDDALKYLRRSEEQSRHYQASRAKLLGEYASMADAVKIRLLSYDFILNSDQLKEAVKPRSSRIVFTLNEFPYYFEEGVEHHVIWSEQELANDHIASVIQENRDGYDAVWFRNPPSMRTIPELWHVHVLSRANP